MYSRILFIPLVILSFFSGCQPNSSPTSTTTDEQNLFVLQPAEKTGITFTNQVENTPTFNIFSYRNFYNGGGVAIGDINNDGFADVFLTRNMGSNELYLNNGDWTFENITRQAGIGSPQKWSTGVVFVDINHDGLLDIYVCNAGFVEGVDQKNELFINNGDLTFSEKAAEFGLDQNGYTTHAAFFDYDLDGDLDVYILNNSFIPVNSLNYSNKRELKAEDWPVKDFVKGGGDKLMRNDGGFFTDVTEEAGIYSSLIGFGLGVTVGDLNGDAWPDLYISNDFFERDYLYINQKDGSFSEEIKKWMPHISLSSMGADMSDINNDGFPEVFVTDMLPDNDYRLKTTSSFEPYQTYDLKQRRDFYHQYMQNTLQFNNRDGSFSEIAYFSGVAASDWSWGALLFDADNDGYRDIFVCNGIYQDVTDQDFIDFFASDIIQQMVLTGKKEEMENVVNRMPSNPIPNKAFRNRADLTFEDVSAQWGIALPSFSNGAAYGDLDNDGDLDLIVNNLNQEAFVFQNRSTEHLKHHYLQIELIGEDPNNRAVGAKVQLFRKGEILQSEVIPSRGFQSSVDYRITTGLGNTENLDSLVVWWPNQQRSVWLQPPIDTLLQIDIRKVQKVALSKKQTEYPAKTATLFTQKDLNLEPHQEDNFVDFYSEGFSYRLLSREGPAVATGDINGDKKPDFFVGNGVDFPPALYLNSGKELKKIPTPSLDKNRDFEDTAAAFFDCDGDGDLDLYVGSGGNHTPPNNRQMVDRLYLNDGEGNFTYQPGLPPSGMNTSFVLPFDFDQDGDLDLIVGSRSLPQNYGLAPRSYLLENDGTGKFKDVTREKAPDLERSGMLTAITTIELNGNAPAELVITGEWMAPLIFEVTENGLQKMESNLSEYPGWWYAIKAADLNGDGKEDLVLGNRGMNFCVTGNQAHPLKLWLADFDDNGTIEKIMSQHVDGRDIPVPLKKEMTEQIVSLKKQNLKHADYARKSMQELFSEAQQQKAQVLEATFFESVVALQKENGQFEVIPLPTSVQFSNIKAIYIGDFNGDGKPDLVTGGNDFGFTPRFGRLDGSYGQLLLNNGEGQFQVVPSTASGLMLSSAMRDILPWRSETETGFIVFSNGEEPVFYQLNQASGKVD